MRGEEICLRGKQVFLDEQISEKDFLRKKGEDKLRDGEDEQEEGRSRDRREYTHQVNIFR